MLNNPPTQGSRPQIIVIPQSMLQGANSILKKPTGAIKPVLRIQPSVKLASAPVGSGKVVLKRSLSPANSVGSVGSDDDASPTISKRKRANLDHMTPEEKMMRRKMKNRVAAQNARDKKRARMEVMEEELNQLRAANRLLETENARMIECTKRLTDENESLKQLVSNTSSYFPPSPSLSTSSSNHTEEQAESIFETSVVHRPSEPAVLADSDLLPKGQGRRMAMDSKKQKAMLFLLSTLLTAMKPSMKSPFPSQSNKVKTELEPAAMVPLQNKKELLPKNSDKNKPKLPPKKRLTAPP